MSDNVAITAGSGTTIGADEVVDGTLGTVKVQYVKLMDGTLDGTTKAAVGANGLAADVKAVVPGTGATALGKAEDGASADGDTGVGMLAVRKASPANTSGTDGDYEFVQMSAGRVWVSATVDAALPAGANAIGKLAANSGVDIGALTANQTVNVAQVNGVATTMGNGASGTGVQRVTIASDSTGQVALAAGTNGVGKLTANAGVNIGDVRNRPTTVHNRFAIAGLTTVTTTYTIGDQAGTMISITGAASANGGTGTLVSLAFLEKGDVGTDYRCHFFRSSVTLASDNAAFAVSDTDMQDWAGEVVIPSVRDLGANRASFIGNIGMGYDCGAGTTLFCAVETRTANAVYAAATDINITPYLVLD